MTNPQKEERLLYSTDKQNQEAPSLAGREKSFYEMGNYIAMFWIKGIRKFDENRRFILQIITSVCSKSEGVREKGGSSLSILFLAKTIHDPQQLTQSPQILIPSHSI